MLTVVGYFDLEVFAGPDLDNLGYLGQVGSRHLLALVDLECALGGELVDLDLELGRVLHVEVLDGERVRALVRDDDEAAGEALLVGVDVAAVARPRALLAGLVDLDDELDAGLLERLGVGELAHELERRLHEQLGAGGDHAALALVAAAVLLRIALLDDELAFEAARDHLVLVRLVLGVDALALEVPVAVGVLVLDLALDLARLVLVGLELRGQAFGEAEGGLFHVQVAARLLLLVDDARVLGLVVLDVLEYAESAAAAELLLRDLVALVVAANRHAVLEPLGHAVVAVDEALESGLLGAEDVHLGRQLLEELELGLGRRHCQVGARLHIVDLAHVLALVLRVDLVDGELVVDAVRHHVVLEALKYFLLVFVPFILKMLKTIKWKIVFLLLLLLRF